MPIFIGVVTLLLAISAVMLIASGRWPRSAVGFTLALIAIPLSVYGTVEQIQNGSVTLGNVLFLGVAAIAASMIATGLRRA